MSEIKGPKGIGSAKGIGAPRGARRAQAAQGPASVTAPDAMVQLFDKVADQLATGALADRSAGVRAAVDAVLAQEFANLPPAVRDAVAADVCVALDRQPHLSARMDRLLRRPG